MNSYRSIKIGAAATWLFFTLIGLGFCHESFGLADCSIQLISSFKKQVDDRSIAIRRLAKRVREEHQLLTKEVTDISTFENAKISLNYVKDEQVRHRLERLTPLGFAARLEILHPNLTTDEWNRAVKIWAEYLDDTGEAWHAFNPKAACGFREEMRSLGTDTADIVVLPLMILIGGPCGPDPNAVLLAPLAPAAGAVASGSDVVTAVPSVLSKHFSQTRTNIHLHSAARQFQKFARLILSYEKKYHRLSGNL